MLQEFIKSLSNQMSDYFVSVFLKFQQRFRMGINAQHCMLSVLEKWKSADRKKTLGVLLINKLSKAFDCSSHKPLRSVQDNLANR